MIDILQGNTMLFTKIKDGGASENPQVTHRTTKPQPTPTTTTPLKSFYAKISTQFKRVKMAFRQE